MAETSISALLVVSHDSDSLYIFLSFFLLSFFLFLFFVISFFLFFSGGWGEAGPPLAAQLLSINKKCTGSECPRQICIDASHGARRDVALVQFTCVSIILLLHFTRNIDDNILKFADLHACSLQARRTAVVGSLRCARLPVAGVKRPPVCTRLLLQQESESESERAPSAATERRRRPYRMRMPLHAGGINGSSMLLPHALLEDRRRRTSSQPMFR